MSLCMTFKAFGQSYTLPVNSEANLKIYIDHNIYTDTPCFQLTISGIGDTIYRQTLVDQEEITLDSLGIGFYSVTLTNCGTVSDEVTQSITKNVEIKAHQLAELDFNFTEFVTYIELDTISLSEIVKSRVETQLELSYFDYRWNPEGNNPKFTVGAAWSGYYWNCFSKHFGYLIGGGMGYSFASLNIDSTVNSLYQKDVKFNYYSYLSGQFDVKFRISSHNQRKRITNGQPVLLDIGLLYNFPFYFKKVTRFNVQDKLVSGFIHQYTDARVYVNIGFTYVQLFFSYRPFDFILGDFQELPRYNAGLKFTVNF